MDLGPVDGGFLEDDGVDRQALRERRQHVARGQRLAGRREGPAAAAARNGCGGSDSRCVEPLGERSSHRSRRREDGQLDRAPMHFGGVVAHERHAAFQAR